LNKGEGEKICWGRDDVKQEVKTKVGVEKASHTGEGCRENRSNPFG